MKVALLTVLVAIAKARLIMPVLVGFAVWANVTLFWYTYWQYIQLPKINSAMGLGVEIGKALETLVTGLIAGLAVGLVIYLAKVG